MSNAASNRKATSPASGSQANQDEPPGVTIFGINPKRFLTIPVKRWRGVLAAVVLSALVGFVAGKQLYEETWQCYGMMMYTKYTPAQSLVSYYQQPDKATIMDENLILSRTNIEALAEEFDVNVAALKGFKIVPPPNIDSDIYTVQLVWEDPAEGAKLVQRLMELHIQLVNRQRRESVTRYIEDTQRNLEAAQQKLADAQTTFDRFVKEHKNSRDPKNDLENLKKDIDSKREERRKKQQELNSKQTKRKKLLERIDELTTRKEGEQKDLPGSEALLQRRLQLGRELAASKRTVDEQKDLLAQARTKLQNDLKTNELFSGSRTAEELEADRVTVRSLERRVKDAEDAVKSVQTELELLKLPSTGNVVLDKARIDESDVGIEIATSLDELQTLEGQLKGMETQAEELAKLKDHYEPLTKTIADEVKNVENLQKELDERKRIQGSGVSDVVIQTKGNAAQYPSNNRTKTTGKWAVISLVFLLGLVVVVETRSRSWRAETMADQLGLPILARAQTTEQQAASGKRSLFKPQDIAALALRLRQYVPESGAPILLSSVAEGHEVDHLVIELARSFAMRDEKVLLLDARIANVPGAGLPRLISRRATQAPVEVAPSRNDAAPGDLSMHITGDRSARVAAARRAAPDEQAGPGSLGLVQYLVFEGQQASHFIFPTRVPSIDYMPAGGPFALTDILASEPMKELFEYLRQTYSLILLVGPALVRAVDTEILAAYANGMVVLINEVQYASESTQFLNALKESDAQLLGCVICV